MEEQQIGPFEIKIEMEGALNVLRVEPQISEQDLHEYKVFEGNELMAVVWPACLDHGLSWCSSQALPEDTLVKIGEAIERFEC